MQNVTDKQTIASLLEEMPSIKTFSYLINAHFENDLPVGDSAVWAFCAIGNPPVLYLMGDESAYNMKVFTVEQNGPVFTLRSKKGVKKEQFNFENSPYYNQ